MPPCCSLLLVSLCPIHSNVQKPRDSQVGCSLSYCEGSVCPYKYANTVFWIFPLIWLHNKCPLNLFSSWGSMEEVGSTNDHFVKSACYTSSRSTALIICFFSFHILKLWWLVRFFLIPLLKILIQGFPFLLCHIVEQSVLMLFVFSFHI